MTTTDQWKTTKKMPFGGDNGIPIIGEDNGLFGLELTQTTEDGEPYDDGWRIFLKWDGCCELHQGKDGEYSYGMDHICDLPKFITMMIRAHNKAIRDHYRYKDEVHPVGHIGTEVEERTSTLSFLDEVRELAIEGQLEGITEDHVTPCCILVDAMKKHIEAGKHREEPA